MSSVVSWVSGLLVVGRLLLLVVAVAVVVVVVVCRCLLCVGWCCLLFVGC